MRIPSGVTDQVIYFVAVDSTDYVTRETGLSSFTVYRDRNGAGAAAMTTPTVTEVDATNMPGVYKLLLDEDMTIGSGNDSEEMVFHITQASMAPVTRTIELYRPKITAGNTLGVASDGDISGNLDGTVATVTTLTGHTPQTGDAYARLGAPAGASVSADIATIDTNVDAILVDTGTTLPATLTTIEGKVDTVDTVVDAILVDTAEIGAAGAGLTAVPWNASWDAEVQSECTDALNAYDPPTNTEMTAAFTEIKGATWASGTDTLEHIRNKQTDIETDTQDLQTQIGTAGAGLTDLGGMSTAMKAEVNAEVDTALATTTYAEPGQGAPAATTSLSAKINYIYKWLRNKRTLTSTTESFYDDAGTTVDQKRTVSDDGTTATKGEIGTGP